MYHSNVVVQEPRRTYWKILGKIAKNINIGPPHCLCKNDYIKHAQFYITTFSVRAVKMLKGRFNKKKPVRSNVRHSWICITSGSTNDRDWFAKKQWWRRDEKGESPNALYNPRQWPCFVFSFYSSLFSVGKSSVRTRRSLVSGTGPMSRNCLSISNKQVYWNKRVIVFGFISQRNFG